MSYTAQDLAALRSSIAKGALSLEQNGEKVTFRSLAEMIAIEARMAAALGEGAGQSRLHTPGFSRGRG